MAALLALLVTNFGCSGSIALVGPPIAAEESAMGSCRYLGTVSENTDPDQIFFRLSDAETTRRVHERGRAMGATHLVWLYRNTTGASAKAFRCP